MLIQRAILVCLSMSLSLGSGQTAKAPGDAPTFDQLVAAGRIYLRDSAEYPMRIKVETVATDLSGRVRHHQRSDVDYDFHGYNPRSQNANATFHGGWTHGRRPLRTAGILSLSSMFFLSILSPGAASSFSLAVSEPDRDGPLWKAVVKPIPQCEPFKWSAKDQAMENFCGSSEFFVRKDDFSLKHLVFDEIGVPVEAEVKPFGRTTIRGYHVEAEFQKVSLPKDPKPFLVPLEVTVTLTCDKGKIVMTGRYTARSKK